MKNKNFMKHPERYEFVTEANQSMRRYRNEIKKKEKEKKKKEEEKKG